MTTEVAVNIQDRNRMAQPQGQATFEMANLRNSTTGLPFVVFISQKGGAQHEVRVKAAPNPKIRPDQMSSYALRPFRLREGAGLSSGDEALLREWVDAHYDVLVSYWDGEIEYTEDVIEQLEGLRLALNRNSSFEKLANGALQ